MSIRFIGVMKTNDFTEAHERTTQHLDRAFTRRLYQMYSNSGWDAVLFEYSTKNVDPLSLAAYCQSYDERLDLVIAVRPNTCVPTYFGKQLASLNALAERPRFRAHVVAGGYGHGQLAEGDSLDKAERYQRTGEFVDILRGILEDGRTLDYSGNYFSTNNFRASFDFPVSTQSTSVSTAGMSDSAIAMAARHSDYHAIWGVPFRAAQDFIDRIASACLKLRRQSLPELQMQFRIVAAETRAEAMTRARVIEQNVCKNMFRRSRGSRLPITGGESYLQSALRASEWHDSAYWAGLVRYTNGAGSSSVLVGSYSEVAETLAEYYRLGFHTFSISELNPLHDCGEIGTEVIPRVRELVNKQ